LSDTIEIPLDISGNGKMPLPPYSSSNPTQIHNITIFLYSYNTGKNFTITNGTASTNNASVGDILFQESGSTVKHVKWTWPDCLVGDGQPTTADSARGVYNVSIVTFLAGVYQFAIYGLLVCFGLNAIEKSGGTNKTGDKEKRDGGRDETGRREETKDGEEEIGCQGEEYRRRGRGRQEKKQ